MTASAVFGGDDPSVSPQASFRGSRVHIQLQDGRIVRDVAVQSCRPGRTPGTVAAVTVLNPSTGKPQVLGAAAIRQIMRTDRSCHLVYDPAGGCLAPRNANQPGGIRAAVKAGAASIEVKRLAKPAALPGSEPPAAAAASAPAEPPAAAAPSGEQQQAGRGGETPAWPELSSQEQEAATDEQEKFLQRVAQSFPALPLRLYETRYFLFLSDMPPDQIALYLPHLDRMYDELARLFGVPPGRLIWRGKALVVAFVAEPSFVAFEVGFCSIAARGVQGLSQPWGDGSMLVACYRGDDRVGFARLLVHETTHGFLSVYRTQEDLPSWLEEGAAEWASKMVVRGDKAVDVRQAVSLAVLKQTRSLGGDFFTVDYIAPWQYGAATSMAEFLMRTSPQGYARLIDSIKLSKPWQQSLQEAYGWTPEQLVAQFGRYLGVPDLRP
jgi:hypothetical protein